MSENLIVSTAGSAILSDCGKYRYALKRKWDGLLTGQENLLGWVMLNPSTADAMVDDPTIRKVIGFSKRAGYNGIYVCNLFAFRSTDPHGLMLAEDPVGSMNNVYLVSVFRTCKAVVVAWGNHGGYANRDQEVLGLLANHEVQPLCLGVTKQKQPKHPLYVPYSTDFIPFNP